MPATLHISGRRFVANIRAVRERIAPSELMLVTKDDAYGHGLAWAAGAAKSAGVSWFGSYDIPSGLVLRRTLGGGPRVFAWATSVEEEVAEAIRADLDLGVGSAAYLELVVATAVRLGTSARVHLKIDTGLHRNGLRPEEWPAVVAAAREAERAGAVRIVGVWSHLAEASDAEDDDAQALFRRSIEQLRATGEEPEALHLTASAASWWRPELRGTVSRVGAFCYGIRSADGPELPGIRPVAALSAPVVAVSEGQAVIGLGAFDGLPSTLRGLEVGTPGGVRTVQGIDETRSRVDAWDGARPGDRVWVFGPGEHGEHSATTLAERIGTVGEEIVTRLTKGVRRVVED